MHDLLIGGLIALIVIIQILVALQTSRKISLFKSIVPKQNTFETVKVFIPENQIKIIKIESIFENIKNYTSIPSAHIHQGSVINSFESSYVENVEGEVDDNINEIQDDFNDTDYYFEDENDDFPIENDDNENSEEDDNEFVWVTKDNMEKKIEINDLRQHQVEGWLKISY